MFTRIVFLVSFVYFADASKVPFLTRCKPDDFKCMKQTAQSAIPIIAAGIPELGVERLDPFRLKSIDASSGNLKLLLKDVSGSGLKDCVAKKVERDLARSKVLVKLQCNVDFTAQYEINGNLLFLPIEGNGDGHVVLRKIIIAVEVGIADKAGADGQNYWTVTDWNYSYNLKDRSTIELDNLFHGNEILGRAARELLSNSGNEVFTEVGPPIVKAVVTEIIRNTKSFLKHVPSTDLTL